MDRCRVAIVDNDRVYLAVIREGRVQRFLEAREFARDAGSAFGEALALNNAAYHPQPAARLPGYEEEQGWLTRRLQELRR